MCRINQSSHWLLKFSLIVGLVLGIRLPASMAQAPQDARARTLLKRVEALESEVDRLTDEVKRLAEELASLREQPQRTGQASGRDTGSRNEQAGNRQGSDEIPLASELYNTDAAKIAFVIDASGSMIGKFDWLRAEIHARINAMSPDQSFVIVAFQEGKAIQLAGRGFFAATDANKRRAHQFLDTLKLAPDSDPLEAMQIAVSAEPDEIWFATDGEFAGGDDEASKILVMNKDQIPIHTFSTLSDKEFWPVLQRLSNKTGGKFVQFSVQEP